MGDAMGGASLGKAVLALAADGSQLQSGIEGEGQKALATLNTIGDALKVAIPVAAVVGAIAGITSALMGMNAMAAEETVGIAQLGLTVSNTGADWNVASAAIETYLAAERQRVGLDDGDGRASLSRLTIVTGDYRAALDLLPLALDLAAAKGMDLQSASDLVGRVAMGNTGILQRYGIVLQEGATSTEALAAMQQKMGGAAEAMANTQVGAYTRMQSTIGEVKETIGGALEPAMTSLYTTIANVAEAALPALEQAATAVGGALQTLADIFGPIADAAITWGSAIVENLAAGIESAAQAVIDALDPIRQIIQDLLEPGSPPKLLPHLDKWGAAAATAYLDGWRQGDATALQSLTDTVGRALEPVSGLIHHYATLADATRAVSDAQRDLNDLTTKYDKELDPLQAALKKITDKQEALRIAKRESALQDILKSDTATAEEKRNARLELEAIRIKKLIAAKEAERDADLKNSKLKLDAAKAEQDRLKALGPTGGGGGGGAAKKDDSAEKAAAEAERRRQAELQYQMSVSDTAKRIALLHGELDRTEKGSVDYYRILGQIDSEQAKLAKEKSDAAKKEADDKQKLLDSLKKVAEDSKKEGEARKKAEWDYQFSVADSATKIKMLEAALGKTEQGSTDYYRILKQVEDERKRAADATKADAEKNQKAAEEKTKAEWDYNYAIADTPTKLKMLEAQLGKTEKGSVEYYRILTQMESVRKGDAAEQLREQEKVARARATAAKEAERVAKEAQRQAEETRQAQLRYMMSISDTAGKIALLKGELANTVPGTAKYYDLMTQIHNLEAQADKEAKAGQKGVLGAIPKKAKEAVEETVKAKLSLEQLLARIPAIATITKFLEDNATTIRDVGLAITVVTGIITGGFLGPLMISVAAFATNFGGFRDFVLTIVGQIIAFIEPMASEVAAFIGTVVGMFQTWATENMPLIQETVETVMSAIEYVIETVLGVIMGLWNFAWPYMQQLMKTIWEEIKLVVTTAINIVLGIIKTVMLAITGDWDGAWTELKRLSSVALDAIWLFVQNILGLILGFFGTNLTAVLGVVTTQFTAIWTAITLWLGNVWTSIVAWFATLGPWWNQKWTNIKTWVETTWNNIWTAIGTWIANILTLLGDKLVEISDAVSAPFKAAWAFLFDDRDGLFPKIIKAIGTWITDTLRKLGDNLTTIKNAVTKPFEDARDFLFGTETGLFPKLIGMLPTWATDIVRTMADNAQRIIDAITAPFKGALDWIKREIIDKILGWIADLWSRIRGVQGAQTQSAIESMVGMNWGAASIRAVSVSSGAGAFGRVTVNPAMNSSNSKATTYQLTYVDQRPAGGPPDLLNVARGLEWRMRVGA